MDELTTPQQWGAYLREYAELYVRSTRNKPERAARPTWRDPASEETVAATEERLGVRFPRGFRSFLLTSDGWGDIGGWTVGGWVEFVFPCEEICWLREDDWGKDLIEDYEDEEPAALMRRTLKVANGEDFWLLDPTDVGPDDEWAAYLFALKYGEFKKFAGFAELFDDSRRILDGDAADE